MQDLTTVCPGQGIVLDNNRRVSYPGHGVSRILCFCHKASSCYCFHTVGIWCYLVSFILWLESGQRIMVPEDLLFLDLGCGTHCLCQFVNYMTNRNNLKRHSKHFLCSSSERFCGFISEVALYQIFFTITRYIRVEQFSSITPSSTWFSIKEPRRNIPQSVWCVTNAKSRTSVNFISMNIHLGSWLTPWNVDLLFFLFLWLKIY